MTGANESLLCVGAVVGGVAPRSAGGAPISQATTLASFCESLERTVRGRVAPTTFEAYDDLVDAIGAGRVQLAWLPPMPAVLALYRYDFVPIAVPVRANGTSYGSALFTRASSPIRHVVDLRGARVAWVDAQSAAGYLFIRASLRARGIDLGAAFGSEAFLGSHDAVVGAVLNDEADVGATYVHFAPDGRGVVRGGWGAADVRVLALAGPIPSDVLAASADLAPEVRRLIGHGLIDDRACELAKAARALLQADDFTVPTTEHLGALDALAAYLKQQDESWGSTLPPSNTGG